MATPWELLNPFVDFGILITLLGLTYAFGSWRSKLNTRLEKIEEAINYLMLLHKEEFIDQYTESWGREHMSNPHPNKQDLLNKMRDGTINYEESLRLKTILEEEKRDARDSGSFGAVIAIGALLGLIAIFLDSLSEEK